VLISSFAGNFLGLFRSVDFSSHRDLSVAFPRTGEYVMKYPNPADNGFIGNDCNMDFSLLCPQAFHQPAEHLPQIFLRNREHPVAQIILRACRGQGGRTGLPDIAAGCLYYLFLLLLL
jgi:hypothetical protein